MRRAAALLLLLVAWPAAADSIETIAEGVARHPGVPGAAVGLVTAEGARVAVAGKRQTLRGPATTEDDRWHLGSLTKAMTATLAARLVERGLLDWDTTVADLLPEPGRYGDATLAALLAHRAGLPPNMPGPLARGAPSRDRFVRAALRLPIAGGTPGRFLYSNVGYVVAAAMLEAAAGETWEALMRREVFEPLGMTGAGFGPPPRNHGHGPGPRAVAPGAADADNPALMGPAGTVHSGAADLAAFLAAHLAWDEGYLSPDSWERLQLDEAYAMGWRVDDEGRLHHVGSNTLWWAVMEIDHAAGRALFVLVNAGDQRSVRAPVLEAVQALREAR
ncbi:serine hydrolase [Jannaschia sp. W003]|uniref:serine hydrolase domain-containing protein n=1 Tax=Jannaschia sp. W003 TaxID=2867012 RepID=UPI0021A8C0A2|nr:serine hydrolase domain-containing protein [Jannaschia sp. W003]UWQ22575.1 beta-lactamase family protein [Jannaschia sp. W003]